MANVGVTAATWSPDAAVELRYMRLTVQLLHTWALFLLLLLIRGLPVILLMLIGGLLLCMRLILLLPHAEMLLQLIKGLMLLLGGVMLLVVLGELTLLLYELLLSDGLMLVDINSKRRVLLDSQ